MSINLIITCDDVALSQGINQSTAELYESGIVSAASLMTNFPTIQETFAYFAQYPELELGVHLNLSDGEPLTEAARQSELVDKQGKFNNRYLLFMYSVFPSDKLLAIIREEMSAQIEVFNEAGLQAGHLTTHCHFHVFPSIRNLVYELADKYHVKWVRNSDFRLSITPFNPMLFFDSSSDVPHEFFVPDYIVSVRHWLNRSPSQLVTDILKVDGTVELVLHPSTKIDEQYPKEVSYLPEERHLETLYIQRFFELMKPYLGGEVNIINAKQPIAVSEKVKP